MRRNNRHLSGSVADEGSEERHCRLRKTLLLANGVGSVIAIFFTVVMGGMITQPIRMLSQITQIEYGAVKLQLESRELKELKSYIFNLFNLAQEDSNLTLEWNVPEDFPAVLADKRFLEWVFVNLIDNAKKDAKYPAGYYYNCAGCFFYQLGVRIERPDLGLSPLRHRWHLCYHHCFSLSGVLSLGR